MTTLISYNDLTDLFAAHAVALARFHRASTAADEIDALNQGREIADSDKEEWELASEAEDAALMAIVRAPVDIRLVRRKAQWLLNHLSMGCALDTTHYLALLESLARARACARGEAGNG